MINYSYIYKYNCKTWKKNFNKSVGQNLIQYATAIGHTLNEIL